MTIVKHAVYIFLVITAISTYCVTESSDSSQDTSETPTTIQPNPSYVNQKIKHIKQELHLTWSQFKQHIEQFAIKHERALIISGVVASFIAYNGLLVVANHYIKKIRHNKNNQGYASDEPTGAQSSLSDDDFAEI